MKYQGDSGSILLFIAVLILVIMPVLWLLAEAIF